MDKKVIYSFKGKAKDGQKEIKRIGLRWAKIYLELALLMVNDDLKGQA